MTVLRVVLVCVVPLVRTKAPDAFLKLKLPSKVRKPNTSTDRLLSTFNSAPSSPSTSSVTAGVAGPVAMAREVAAVSCVLLALSAKSYTVLGATRLLVLFTSTLSVVTVAFRPVMPPKVALPTLALSVM